MADTFARMKQLVGTTAEWAANNIVLGEGEIGVERIGVSDHRAKCGDGVKTWSQLPYLSGTAAAVDAQVAAASAHAVTATTQAGIATTKASEASASQAAAAASQSAAAASETNAANSATSAASSASAAGAASGRLVVATFSDLATIFGYSSAGGRRAVAAGDLISVLDIDATYRVALSSDSSSHLNYTGTGGIRLYVIPKESAYNVMAFGAKGDGSTNDTNAIQSAINAATGGLEFPHGSYLVTSLSVSSKSNLKIYGNRALVINTTAQANGMFRIASSTNIEISGLILEGTDTSVALTSGYQYHAIYASSCTGLNINNCEIRKMTSGGILTVLCNNVRICDNYIHSNRNMFDIAFGYGVNEVSPGGDLSPLTNCWIKNNRCESVNRYGIHIQGGGRNVIVQNNTIKNKYEYGILVYTFSGTVVVDGVSVPNLWERIVISGNVVSDTSHNTVTPGLTYYSGMGIYLQTVRYATVTGNVVINSLLNRPDASAPNRTLPPGAISLNGFSESICSGNAIVGSEIDGIDIVNVSSGNKGTTISGNTLIDVAFTGIYANATENVSVTGNALSGRTTGTIRGAGISVLSHSSQPTGRMVVSGNAVKGGFNQGILVGQGTGTSIDGIVINGNEITDVALTYLSAANTNDFTISSNVLRNVSAEHGSGSYALQVSSSTDGVISGNVISGNSTNKFNRGVAVTGCTDCLVSSNSIFGITDQSFVIYLASNTSVNAYLNKSERNTNPIITGYNIGNDLQNDTNIQVVYVTAVPTTGTFSRGSIAWNLTPSAGGPIGWACVSSGTPGTWRAMASLAGD